MVCGVPSAAEGPSSLAISAERRVLLFLFLPPAFSEASLFLALFLFFVLPVGGFPVAGMFWRKMLFFAGRGGG